MQPTILIDCSSARVGVSICEIKISNLHAMTTSNPISDYRFSWAIEKLMYSSGKRLGLPFSPIQGFPGSFCFECENEVAFCTASSYQHFHVRLVNLNSTVLEMYVSADITLSYKQTILFRKKCDRTRIQPSKTSLIDYKFPIFNEEEIFIGLLLNSYDNLKLEGTLTFSGYELSTSVSVEPLAIQEPPGNCAISELVKDFEAMYESGRFSDVTFTIGEVKLSAHKALLAARSPVFAKMFDHRMLESITNNVTIEDIDTNTFKDFLLFLYTGGVGELNCESVVSLYPVSKKYQVPSLQKFCVLSLRSVLTVAYACDVLLLADMYEDEELLEIAKIFVQKKFLDIVVATEWAELVINQPGLAKEVVDFVYPVPNN